MGVRMILMDNDDSRNDISTGESSPVGGAPAHEPDCVPDIVAQKRQDDWFPNAPEALLVIIALFFIEKILSDYAAPAGKLLYRLAPRAMGGADVTAGTLAEAATLLALLSYLLVIRKYPAKKLGLIFRPLPLNLLRGLGYSIFAFLGAIIFTLAVFSAIGGALLALGWNANDILNLFNRYAGSGREKDIMRAVSSPQGFVFSVALVPVFEELVFRGLMYGALRSVMPAWPAAAISSIIFTGLHLYVIGVPAIFFMSMVSCWAYERNRSIAPCIAMHGLWNLRTFMMAGFHF